MAVSVPEERRHNGPSVEGQDESRVQIICMIHDETIANTERKDKKKKPGNKKALHHCPTQ